jgi:hypothetical protein
VQILKRLKGECKISKKASECKILKRFKGEGKANSGGGIPQSEKVQGGSAENLKKDQGKVRSGKKDATPHVPQWSPS